MKTRIWASAVAASLALSFGLAGCGSDEPADDPITEDSPAVTDESFNIGVAVFVAHPSLQLVQEGFADYLDEMGVDVTYTEANAQADSTAVATIATTFAGDPDLDLILAISTPIAQAIVQQETTRPVLYAAVTDPADAGLVEQNEGPSGTNVTGASDMNPDAKPVELIQQIVPDVKTIGVLYSSSEANSVAQVTSYKAEAAPLGIEIRDTAITTTAEIATAVATMTDVDAILIPTDNTVVSGIAPVIEFGETNQIPVFTADADTLSKGTIASRGISYYDQGREVGQMAYQILVEGKPVEEVPAVLSRQTTLFVNPDAAEKMGVTIPADLMADAEIVNTETE